MRKTRKTKVKSFWLKIVELGRDARQRVLELRAEATAAPLPARHPVERRWVHFDALEVVRGDRSYVFRYLLDGVVVKEDRRAVPTGLQDRPADLVAWAVMDGWRASDLLVSYPRLDGKNDVYHFPAAPKLAAGQRPMRRQAGPALLAPGPATG